jgi:multidrug resistance efflux pump
MSWLTGALLLACLVLGLNQAVWAGEAVAAPPEAAAAEPPPEVAFIGKFSCPIKRQVNQPFQGIITSIRAQAGQKVSAGDALVTYRLTPEAVLAVNRRLNNAQTKEMEAKVADAEKALSQVDAKEREIALLYKAKLAPEQALTLIKKERQLLARQRGVFQERLQQERRVAEDDMRVLKKQLGTAPNGNMLEKEFVLKSPIDGYIVYTNPDLREGAEIDPNAPVFQIGVMDPMVVKAQVHEMECQHLAVGDQAEITADSLPGSKFTAKVSRISWAPIVPLKMGLEQPTYYEAEFQVPNPQLSLKEGMKVRVVLRKGK